MVSLSASASASASVSVSASLSPPNTCLNNGGTGYQNRVFLNHAEACCFPNKQHCRRGSGFELHLLGLDFHQLTAGGTARVGRRGRVHHLPAHIHFLPRPQGSPAQGGGQLTGCHDPVGAAVSAGSRHDGEHQVVSMVFRGGDDSSVSMEGTEHGRFSSKCRRQWLSPIPNSRTPGRPRIVFGPACFVDPQARVRFQDELETGDLQR